MIISVFFTTKLAGALKLAKQDGWQAVYFDNLAVVLVKKVNQYPQLAGLKLPVEGDAGATEGRAAWAMLSGRIAKRLPAGSGVYWARSPGANNTGGNCGP